MRLELIFNPVVFTVPEKVALPRLKDIRCVHGLTESLKVIVVPYNSINSGVVACAPPYIAIDAAPAPFPPAIDK